MMKLNNNAFTLTELLMVVLMIGILSAMVLPKYTKVIDSFRVLEAQRMMQAVRSEQETRCTLGKKYTAEANKLGVFSANNANNATYTTSNFVYTLSNDGGISAAPVPARGYTLVMPSYLDGRICCDECANFTKNYLTCTALTSLGNFQAIKQDDACKPQS